MCSHTKTMRISYQPLCKWKNKLSIQCTIMVSVYTSLIMLHFILDCNVSVTDAIFCQCELCGKGFKGREEMRRHMRTIHMNIYRYQCEKCGHGIDRKKDLESHVCGRTKNRLSNLAFRNMKAEGGEKANKKRSRGKKPQASKAEEYDGNGTLSGAGAGADVMQQEISVGHMEVVGPLDTAQHVVAVQYLSDTRMEEPRIVGQPAFYTFQEHLK